MEKSKLRGKWPEYYVRYSAIVSHCNRIPLSTSFIYYCCIICKPARKKITKILFLKIAHTKKISSPFYYLLIFAQLNNFYPQNDIQFCHTLMRYVRLFFFWYENAMFAFWCIYKHKSIWYLPNDTWHSINIDSNLISSTLSTLLHSNSSFFSPLVARRLSFFPPHNEVDLNINKPSE